MIAGAGRPEPDNLIYLQLPSAVRHLRISKGHPLEILIRTYTYLQAAYAFDYHLDMHFSESWIGGDET
jgi:hypothetical protein